MPERMLLNQFIYTLETPNISASRNTLVNTTPIVLKTNDCIVYKNSPRLNLTVIKLSISSGQDIDSAG